MTVRERGEETIRLLSFALLARLAGTGMPLPSVRQ